MFLSVKVVTWDAGCPAQRDNGDLHLSWTIARGRRSPWPPLPWAVRSSSSARFARLQTGWISPDFPPDPSVPSAANRCASTVRKGW